MTSAGPSGAASRSRDPPALDASAKPQAKLEADQQKVLKLFQGMCDSLTKDQTMTLGYGDRQELATWFGKLMKCLEENDKQALDTLRKRDAALKEVKRVTSELNAKNSELNSIAKKYKAEHQVRKKIKLAMAELSDGSDEIGEDDEE
ncbi:hypothetical protein BD324DRAFT_284981 [Kockovaella imperatae]|uniref:Uncharacterized protein n=1 Tax=Kockovaella imperatae TaxID=4999 RepID=A0A1Y1U5R7_9TREE|nr:hypothetical protein BD324DRAFT_284981 [Kockovaella imperatae]ORX33373.1 hypothetical protein BD324DRAFT_284981 [Kockovaella imperatae]